jgi:hypothetical protein
MRVNNVIEGSDDVIEGSDDVIEGKMRRSKIEDLRRKRRCNDVIEGMMMT